MNSPDRNAVLVIDPDPSTRALIVALLRRRGYVAETAARGEEALRLHRNRRHAAVIVDPGVEGGDSLLHALQTAGGTDAPAPNVIVVTTPEQPHATWAGRPGVRAVLFKPFSLTDLTEAVAMCRSESCPRAS